ncbi:MAG: replicative DNA helicase [Gammaproteobacteria bacterium]|jgi:replicative DNA helicase|nr:replicative DNA helicase [Gammaproteobacteria bacterium]
MAEAATELIRSKITPPHSIEAEQALLGSLLLTPTSFAQIEDIVTSVDFYRNDHAQIYKAISELNHRNTSADVVTVFEYFESRNDTDGLEGGAYLTSLANNVVSAANVSAYAGIVREKSILRQLIDIGNNIAGSAYKSDGKSAQQLLEQAERQIFGIAEKGLQAVSNYESIAALLKPAYDQIAELSKHKSDITGVATNLTDLDRHTAGLQKSDLIILAGRPAMGKTSLAMNIAQNAAINSNVPVAVFSMEMSKNQLAFRLFSSLGAINQSRLRTGKLTEEDWNGLKSAMGMLKNAPIYIDDTPSLSPAQVRARARRLKREFDIGLVVIDYLQLMQVPDTRENRATEIAEISRGLKALAKELDIPVIALSQLNRALEQRPNKRPAMADLRESGSIEQDADLILFIYRDEVYNPDTPAKNLAEVIIGKHRNGATGTVELLFEGEYLRFKNYSRIEDDFHAP